LRIKIDKQNAMAQLRQPSAEIYGCGRFADAAFLVSDRDDFHNAENNQSVLRILSGLRGSPDDVAGRAETETKFFGFQIWNFRSR